MRPADEVLRDLVRQWVVKADSDLRAAEQLLEAEVPIPEVVAFHCQQAAEKYLKALLVRHQVQFPKTHDVRQLLDLLSAIEPDTAISLEEAAVLTPYGVEIRYPGDFPEVGPGEEARLLGLATRVKDAVSGLLKPYLAGGPGS